MTYPNLTHFDLHQKRLLIREDFNVPIQNGKMTSDARIRAALPTLQYALQQNACVLVMSHLRRPEEGKHQSELSLKPVADCLSELLHHPVKFITDWDAIPHINPGEIALLENVRFLKGEKKNDPLLSQKMASLCDIFVMDAFATSHRAESSTCGVIEYAPHACIGFLLQKELDALEQATQHPAKPLIAIVGGSKISTKLAVLENLLKKVDQLIVGGGIANTFLAAKGFPIGKSLVEIELISIAKKLLTQAAEQNIEIPLPTDVVVATEFSETAAGVVKSIEEVAANEMILDIGPQTAKYYADLLHNAKTIVWNGPVGVFEFPAFENGTRTLAKAIAQSNAFSLAGGGDTIAAIEKYHVSEKISYISTGGGAFLEFIEGKTLPSLAALQRKPMTIPEWN